MRPVITSAKTDEITSNISTDTKEETEGDDYVWKL